MSEIMNMGPFTWPLLLIAAANLVLTGLRAAELGKATADDRDRLESRIDTILFWGVVAVLLGFLGQYGGLYRSMNGVASMDSVGPGLVARGIAESIMPTIVGLAILVLSSIAWFALRTGSRRLA